MTTYALLFNTGNLAGSIFVNMVRLNDGRSHCLNDLIHGSLTLQMWSGVLRWIVGALVSRRRQSVIGREHAYS